MTKKNRFIYIIFGLLEISDGKVSYGKNGGDLFSFSKENKEVLN